MTCTSRARAFARRGGCPCCSIPEPATSRFAVSSTATTYTVRIDKQSCSSSQRCANAVPEGFVMDEDHLGDVLPGAAELPLERLLEVARNCPVLAISIYDEDGNEVEL